MIRHIVALRFQPGAEKPGHYAELEALLPLIPGALAFRSFENISPEEPVVHGFKDGFWFDFTDAATRDAYLIHSAHQKAGSRLAAACGGAEGILVLDIEV
jgi:Stress responsive A/B Barrel Domain